jgi:hypothetical protein
MASDGAVDEQMATGESRADDELSEQSDS